MVIATQLSEITLSPAAAARVRWIADRKDEADAALRRAVDGGGCSGFTYRFGLAEEIDADDVITETDGVKLVVDPVSIDLVRGCVVDFVDSLGGSSFQVENPNAAADCCCGSSFSSQTIHSSSFRAQRSNPTVRKQPPFLFLHT